MEEIKGVGEMIKQRGKVNGGEKRGEERADKWRVHTRQ